MKIREGLQVAEFEAWRVTGARHRRKLIGFRVFLAVLPALAVAAAIGALGYGAYRLWSVITGSVPATGATAVASAGPAIASVSPAAWVIAVTVAIAAAITVRLIARPYAPGFMILRIALVATLLAGAGGFWWGVS